MAPAGSQAPAAIIFLLPPGNPWAKTTDAQAPETTPSPSEADEPKSDAKDRGTPAAEPSVSLAAPLLLSVLVPGGTLPIDGTPLSTNEPTRATTGEVLRSSSALERGRRLPLGQELLSNLARREAWQSLAAWRQRLDLRSELVLRPASVEPIRPWESGGWALDRQLLNPGSGCVLQPEAALPAELVGNASDAENRLSWDAARDVAVGCWVAVGGTARELWHSGQRAAEVARHASIRIASAIPAAISNASSDSVHPLVERFWFGNVAGTQPPESVTDTVAEPAADQAAGRLDAPSWREGAWRGQWLAVEEMIGGWRGLDDLAPLIDVRKRNGIRAVEPADDEASGSSERDSAPATEEPGPILPVSSWKSAVEPMVAGAAAALDDTGSALKKISSGLRGWLGPGVTGKSADRSAVRAERSALESWSNSRDPNAELYFGL